MDIQIYKDEPLALPLGELSAKLTERVNEVKHMTNAKFKKLITLTVALLLLLNISVYVLASAKTAIDLSEKGSITLVLKDKETGAAISGKKFSLYRVATVRPDGDS
ncbi:MAG: hypothetical protein IJ962_03630, partial [Clostridia bacterium]|nr:hypothetical protein [Clostridia bacterium]